MQKVLTTLKERKEFLDNIINQAERELRVLEKTVPPGYLHAYKRKGTEQFTLMSKAGTRYFRKGELQTVKLLAQREYLNWLLKGAYKEDKAIDDFLKKICYRSVEDAHLNMTEIKRKLVDPIVTTDEEYIKKWLEENKTDPEYKDNERIYKTDNGEKVRSKSERSIANILKKRGIPYVYEVKLKIGDRTFHPDFMLLNVTEKKVYYWEHFGRMGEEDYLRNNAWKLIYYQKYGIYTGKNFLMTLENDKAALLTENVEAILDEVFPDNKEIPGENSDKTEAVSIDEEN